MDPLAPQSPGREVWALATRQHWVVTHRQLLALGLSRDGIKHRIATRRLHPLWRTVYAVGRPEVSRAGRFMAAVLACGPDACLSHASAAELWQLAAPTDPIHVSTLAGADRRHPGIAVHRRISVAAHDVTRFDDIPVTTPLCTIVDVAPTLSPAELHTVINEADKRDLVDPESLRVALDEERGRRGVGVLRRVLDRETFTLTDSELERRFLPLARNAGLPTPETQAYVNGYRVDFYWPELGLVVETDGLRYHRTAAQQRKDRVRDQAHAAAGLTVLRFTRAQIHFEPRYVEGILASVARRLRS